MPRRHRPRRRSRHAAGPDRLSDVPDCLLHIILSLSSMGARRLVQTSALSRRWRNLWRDMPCLDVGQHEFQADSGSNDLDKWVRFNNFVDSLVQQHSALDLDTLRIQVAHPPKDRDGDSWVHRFLARYSPAVLDIHNHSPGGAHVELRCMTDDTVLRRLPTLRLTGVTLCDGLEQLLGAQGCPMLEHLELKDCLIAFDQVVVSPTLKTLVVDSSNCSMDPSRLLMWRTPRIVAPGLASLDLALLQDYAHLWVFEMPSLVEATVRISRHYIYGDDEFRLICSLQNVTRLELSTFPWLDEVIEDLDDIDNLPEFHNLTTLILDECDLTGETLTLLEFFLHHAPNLEKLTLHNCKLPPSSEKMEERCMSMKMSCKHLNLKSAEIKHREKDDYVSWIVEYLLRVSKNLQRNDIVLSKGL